MLNMLKVNGFAYEDGRVTALMLEVFYPEARHLCEEHNISFSNPSLSWQDPPTRGEEGTCVHAYSNLVPCFARHQVCRMWWWFCNAELHLQEMILALPSCMMLGKIQKQIQGTATLDLPGLAPLAVPGEVSAPLLIALLLGFFPEGSWPCCPRVLLGVLGWGCPSAANPPAAQAHLSKPCFSWDCWRGLTSCQQLHCNQRFLGWASLVTWPC